MEEKTDYFIVMGVPFLLKENDGFVWNKRAAFICSALRYASSAVPFVSAMKS
jgi:hypothetical protein